MKIIDVLDKLDKMGYTYQFEGNKELEIEGFSDPKSYVPGTIIWVGKTEDIHTDNGLCYEDIALVFAKEEAHLERYVPNTVILDDPKTAFMKLVYAQYALSVKAYIAPTAQISKEAVIGENCYIANNVVIESGVIIGDHCIIRENTFVGKGTAMGEGCVIGQNVVLAGETNGSSFVDSDGILKNMPNIGGLRIGHHVYIGAGSLIANGTFSDTVIGDECEVNAGTSIGHNCKIGARVQLLGRCTLSGNTTVGDRCQLISAFVKNRIMIGNDVKVGIGSVVLKDIPDGKTCFGNPARVMPG